MSKLSRYIIQQAIRELAEATDEFTQYDLHTFVSEILGRELTPAEKKKITLIARNEVEVKEVKRDPETKVRIYIFML